jgi:hypothetical protein
MPELTWNTERYTTDIEEPDWFEAEAFDVDETWSTPPEGTTQQAGAHEAIAAEQVTSEPPPVEGAAAAPQLEAAAEMEVAPTGREPDSPIGADRRPERELPGTAELDQALAALESAGGPPPEAAPPSPEPDVHPATGTRPDWPIPDVVPTRPPAAPARPTASTRSTTPVPPAPATDFAEVDDEPDEWPPRSADYVRRATQPGFGARPGSSSADQGPASRAYRRLRRIFPD